MLVLVRTSPLDVGTSTNISRRSTAGRNMEVSTLSPGPVQPTSCITYAEPSRSGPSGVYFYLNMCVLANKIFMIYYFIITEVTE